MSWKEFYLKQKGTITGCIVAVITGVLIVTYSINTRNHSTWIKPGIHTDSTSEQSAITSSLPQLDASNLAVDEFPDDGFATLPFDINGSDVIVFLHMQKTGGTTFGRHLVRNLKLVKECDILEGKKRRNCLRPNSDTETWLFSRYSTGWLCGLHSDWTELHECVNSQLDKYEQKAHERRYFYVTMLRNPVDRYISEYFHVNRGATWWRTKYSCDHHRNDIPPCFEGEDWRGVSMDDFLSCRFNMAANRQTRMLADLHLVNCYERWINTSLTHQQVVEMEERILQSAKDNLKNLSFFGLLEEQLKMQALFEYAFPLKFKRKFFQHNTTRISNFAISKENLQAVERLNHMDMQLYDYGRRLFESRYTKFIERKPDKPL